MTIDKREIVHQHLKRAEDMSEPERAGLCEPTIDFIALFTGMAPQNVRNNLAKLEKDDRAYIIAWTRHRAPVWAAGKGISAPKPRAMSRDERLEKKKLESRAKRAASPEPYENDATRSLRSRRRVEETIEGARRKPMQWYSWLETP